MLSEKYDNAILTLSAFILLIGCWVTYQLPNALLPNIGYPQLVLKTTWGGKSAAEIQQVLVAPLEHKISNIPNLRSYQTLISPSLATTTLTFTTNTDMQRAYIDVMARIGQISRWPPQVPKPQIIDNSNGAGATLASLFLYAEGEATPQQLANAYEQYVERELLALDEIADIVMDYNRLDRRLNIELKPTLLATLHITLDDIKETLHRFHPMSAGKSVQGKYSYEMMLEGQTTVEDILALPVVQRNQRTIFLKDVASITESFTHQWTYSSFNGNPAIYFFPNPAKNISVLTAINALNERINYINTHKLAATNLRLAISRDDSKVIKKALSLLSASLIIGLILALGVLWYFFRHVGLLCIVALTTPICLSLVMISMWVVGKSVNVISLAALALSIGVLMDATIITLEAIVKEQQKGNRQHSATYAVQLIKRALVASAITSIAVFLPLIWLKSSTAQVFQDLAFIMSSALISALFIALFLVPSLFRKLSITHHSSYRHHQSRQYSLNFIQSWLQNTPLYRWSRRLFLVLTIPAALVLTVVSLPNLTLLPAPKEPVVISYVNFDKPIAQQYAQQHYASTIERRISEQVRLGKAPQFTLYGLFCTERYCLFYFYPEAEWNMEEFKKWIVQQVTHELEDAKVNIFQGSLLRLSLPDNKATYIDIFSASKEITQQWAQTLKQHLQQTFTTARITEVVPIKADTEQLIIQPNYEHALRYGITKRVLDDWLTIFTDGLYIGAIQKNSIPYDVLLTTSLSPTQQELLDKTLSTTRHEIINLHELIQLKPNQGSMTLFHSNGKEGVSLRITPPPELTEGQFVEQLMREVQKIKQPTTNSVIVEYRGSANQFAIFMKEIKNILFIATIVLFSLMQLTFKDLRYSSAIMLSLILPITGAVVGLNLLNTVTTQQLDIVTSIGFIILLGLVINNAILFVEAYKGEYEQSGNTNKAALFAVSTRTRPILLSSLTSILGMLPLIINPDAIAEIYRGLATVIATGMLASVCFGQLFLVTVLTYLIPTTHPHK